MKIKSAELETVCGITSKLPENTHPEVAFCGRSNVGKSSLINCLMERKSLARTSGQPGKTQTLNFYLLNKEIYLVDLPGYGYAKTARTTAEKWGKMIERYLTSSEMLRLIFLLVDMRHAPSNQDVQMFEWIKYLDLQPIVIATKSDKIKKNERAKSLSLIKQTLNADSNDIIVPFSSETKEGRDDIIDFLDQVIEAED
ncbi:MAG: ribosome biogenesis GTP-binding protein YihA/YsxC [Lachnospiraceae bacterium]|nr:ribosome biogenesis GTP-binding protein YihA/YsxC [Lachnospiraceae bacterium]